MKKFIKDDIVIIKHSQYTCLEEVPESIRQIHKEIRTPLPILNVPFTVSHNIDGMLYTQFTNCFGFRDRCSMCMEKDVLLQYRPFLNHIRRLFTK